MDNANWLEQVREEIIDPELPICDPHHHLWDLPGSRYLIDELTTDLAEGLNGRHNIVSTVFMECMAMYRAKGPVSMQPVGETEFVTGVAAMSASGSYGPTRACAAIVGFADLTLGAAVRPVLEAHQRASPDRFRGIRHATSWHSDKSIRRAHTKPDEKVSESDAFRAGFEVLGEMGLSFDAWCYHEQIPEIAQLARDYPNTRIVLDHFGGPLGIGPYAGRQQAVFKTWQQNVDLLAPFENVFFKLGGINMKVNGFDWHRRDTPPSSDELVAATGHYYQHCIETFGADRCMFESNFPVDKASCSYHVLFNAFKKIAAPRTSNEIASLFQGTAAQVYRIAD